MILIAVKLSQLINPSGLAAGNYQRTIGVLLSQHYDLPVLDDTSAIYYDVFSEKGGYTATIAVSVNAGTF